MSKPLDPDGDAPIAEAEVAPVRALSRGLQVLIALNELAPATVARVTNVTGLPKATVIRLIQTLKAEGYVADGEAGYEPTPKVRLLAGALADQSLMLQVSRPILSALADIVKWPCDLMVRDGLSMLIEATNRDTAPIGLKRFEQRRFSLLRSASGTMWLLHLGTAERERLIRAALPLQDGDETPETVAARLARARERGYGLARYDAPIDGTTAISVPALLRGRPIACLSLIFLEGAVSEAQIDAKLLPELKRAAEDVASAHARYDLAPGAEPRP